MRLQSCLIAGTGVLSSLCLLAGAESPPAVSSRAEVNSAEVYGLTRHPSHKGEVDAWVKQFIYYKNEKFQHFYVENQDKELINTYAVSLSNGAYVGFGTNIYGRGGKQLTEMRYRELRMDNWMKSVGKTDAKDLRKLFSMHVTNPAANTATQAALEAVGEEFSGPLETSDPFADVDYHKHEFEEGKTGWNELIRGNPIIGGIIKMCDVYEDLLGYVRVREVTTLTSRNNDGSVNLHYYTRLG
ncbi:Uu.00g012560.m01.CDS01 [Anthostomella pinea]|uniref:Uu.00g012560.m01.CDS01 n=1 Tax=Anthostomella pinea TaxID=933095 RepID=A0AAI8VY11_9PEZI|nr:Uu.00g012560.m01.CDS01 [Anthostomella pinea]